MFGIANAKQLTAASRIHVAVASALVLNDATQAASHVNALSGGLDIDGMLESAGSWIFIGGDTALDGGTISPGGTNAIGALKFGSVFTLGAAARLREELESDGSYDKLVVAGNAFIGGTVEVHPLNGYAPALGTSWNIVTQSAGVSNMGYAATPGASRRAPSCPRTVTARGTRPWWGRSARRR